MAGTELGIEITGRRLADICRLSAFNEMQCEVEAIAHKYYDTEGVYALQLKEGFKITKARRAELTAFLRGIVCCYKAM